MVTAVGWASLVLAGFAPLTRTRAFLCHFEIQFAKKECGFTGSEKYMSQGWASLVISLLERHPRFHLVFAIIFCLFFLAVPRQLYR